MGTSGTSQAPEDEPAQEAAHGAGQGAGEDDDDFIEVEGHPKDRRQQAFTACWCKNEWVCNEEIPFSEEVDRVEKAAKRLIKEVMVSHDFLSL